MPQKSVFADLIRRRVRASGLSRYAVAKRAGIGVAVVQRFMDRSRGLNLATAEKICRVVGLDLRPVEGIAK